MNGPESGFPAQVHTIAEHQQGIALDEFLCQLFPGASKRSLRLAVRSGKILVNAMPAQPSRKLGSADVVSLAVEENELDGGKQWGAPPRTPTILYEDDHVVAVDKPAGLPVEPERWDPAAPCLVGAMLQYAASCQDGEFRPRLVHRIDKDTSGCVVVAKSLEAERELREAFDSRRVRKLYLALVEGEWNSSSRAAPDAAADEWSEIDLPIGPQKGRGGGKAGREHRQAVLSGGQAARTRVRCSERFRGYSLLECEPLTGRTHQIRVHLSASGFPLAVDPLYGRRSKLLLSEWKSSYRRKPGQPERPLLERLSLHAARLTFPSPGTAGTIEVQADVPADLARTLKQLHKLRPVTP